MEDWDERMDQQAKQIKEIFAKNGLTSYIENSGFKGRHVWIFFQEAVSATVARNVLRKLFDKLQLVLQPIVFCQNDRMKNKYLSSLTRRRDNSFKNSVRLQESVPVTCYECGFNQHYNHKH